MKTYFIRHAESLDASQNLVQRRNSQLSGKGMKQANEISKSLLNIPFDYLASSPLLRARQTLEIIASNISNHQTLETLNLLEEERRPTEILGLSHTDEVVKNILKQIDENYYNPDYRYSDEDNFYDLVNRVNELKAYLEKAEHENLLLVSHGNLIKMFMMVLKYKHQLTPAIFKSEKIEIPNTKVYLWEYDNEWKEANL